MMRLLVLFLALALVAAEGAAPATPVQKTIDGLFKSAPKVTGVHDLERLGRDFGEDSDNEPELDDAVEPEVAVENEDDAAEPVQAEDEDSSVVAHATSVTNNLELELEESALPSDTREMAKNIIAGIRHDLEMIPSVSSSRKTKLVKAASLRIKAAKQLLLADKETLDEHPNKAARVASDTEFLASKVRALHMPSSSKRETLENLEHIKMDAEELTETPPGHKRDKIQKALSLRMSALKAELGKSEARKSDPSSARVHDDTQQLMEEVKSSDMPSSTKHEVMANLKHINMDAEELTHTSNSNKRSHITKAIHLRMSALKDQLRSSKDEDPMCSGVACKKVQSDVRALEERLKSSDLSVTEKAETMSNLEAIAEDASKLSSGHMSASSKAKVQKALKLRMKALKDEIGMEASVPSAGSECSGVACKVEKDVRALEERLGSTELSAAAKREVKSNLDSIAKDAVLLSSAAGHKREKLQKAIQFRMNALKSQLNAEETGVQGKPAAAKHSKHAAAPKHSKHAAAPKHSKPSAEKKVMQDLDRMEAKIEAMSGVSKKMKKDMEENLHAIAKDSKRLSSASTKKKADLQKAIQYRMKALKKEIAGVKSA